MRIGQGKAALGTFAFLAIVCLAQIVWWTYLLIGESRRLRDARLELAETRRELGEESSPEFRRTVNEELRHRTIMIVSEGAFFLVLTLGGAFLIYRTLRRERELTLQQNDFIASAGHELKTPIAAMRLALQTIARPDLPRDKAVRFAAHIEKDLGRLEALVHMILKAGQIESGRLAFHLEVFDLAEELKQQADLLGALAQERGCDLELDVDGPLPVRADRQALRSIVANLVDNAAKYAKEGLRGRVRLALRRSGTYAVIEVSDNGIGIEPGDLKRVFERFYRGGDERVRSRPGTGLGLYVVRELVEEQGGKIEAESAGRGRGATFRVALPAEAGKVA